MDVSTRSDGRALPRPTSWGSYDLQPKGARWHDSGIGAPAFEHEKEVV